MTFMASGDSEAEWNGRDIVQSDLVLIAARSQRPQVQVVLPDGSGANGIIAKTSMIETPTWEDLARIDRKRNNKASNQDWHNPNDADARITKIKDGSTHLAHKVEHAVDMDNDAR